MLDLTNPVPTGIDAGKLPLPSLSEANSLLERRVLCRFGTASGSAWLTYNTERLTVQAAYAFLAEGQPGAASWNPGAVAVVAGPNPAGQTVARHVRDLSGLPTDRIAEIFPVARETFQRWVSGTSQPSTPNLERLLRLQHVLREACNRVPDTRVWLLTPADELGGRSPFSALSDGQLTQVADALQALPPRYPNPRYVDGDGHRITQVLHGVRAPVRATSEEELSDFSDWDDDR